MGIKLSVIFYSTVSFKLSKLFLGYNELLKQKQIEKKNSLENSTVFAEPKLTNEIDSNNDNNESEDSKESINLELNNIIVEVDPKIETKKMNIDDLNWTPLSFNQEVTEESVPITNISGSLLQSKTRERKVNKPKIVSKINS